MYLQVLQAFARAEKKLKPNWREMFTEVRSPEKKMLFFGFWPNYLPPPTIERLSKVQHVFSMEILEGVKWQISQAAYNGPKQL